MSWWIYSSEALPNPELMGKPRYTPDNCWIKWGGVSLPAIPKKQWMKLPDSTETLRRNDWRDKQGTVVEIPIRRYKPIVDSQFSAIGVIMLDHDPSAAEKEKLEAVSEKLNLEYRRKAIEFFENQRQIALARQGTYEPNPYVDECYEVLGTKKPYSVDALMAQRDPGAQAALRIADAMVGALKQDRKDREDVAMAVATAVTQPEPPKVAAPRR